MDAAVINDKQLKIVTNGIVRNRNDNIRLYIPHTDNDITRNVLNNKKELIYRFTLCFKGEIFTQHHNNSLLDNYDDESSFNINFNTLTNNTIDNYQSDTIDFIECLSLFIKYDFDKVIPSTFKSSLLEQLLSSTIENSLDYIDTLFDTNLSTLVQQSILNNQLIFWFNIHSSFINLIVNIKRHLNSNNSSNNKSNNNNQSNYELINRIQRKLLCDFISLLDKLSSKQINSIDSIVKFIKRLNKLLDSQFWNHFNIQFKEYFNNIDIKDYQYSYIKCIKIFNSLNLQLKYVIGSNWQGVFNIVTEYINWIDSVDSLQTRMDRIRDGRLHIERLLNLMLELPDVWYRLPDSSFYLDDEHENLEIFTKIFAIIYDLAYLSIDFTDKWFKFLDIYLNHLLNISSNNNSIVINSKNSNIKQKQEKEQDLIKKSLNVCRTISSNLRNRMKDTLIIERLPEKYSNVQDQLMGIALPKDFKQFYQHKKRMNQHVPHTVLRLYALTLKKTTSHLLNTIVDTNSNNSSAKPSSQQLLDEISSSMLKITKLIDFQQQLELQQEQQKQQQQRQQQQSQKNVHDDDIELIFDTIFTLIAQVDCFDKIFGRVVERLKEMVESFRKSAKSNNSFYISLMNDFIGRWNLYLCRQTDQTIIFTSPHELYNIVSPKDDLIILTSDENRNIIDYIKSFIHSFLTYIIDNNSSISTNNNLDKLTMKSMINNILTELIKISIDSDEKYQQLNSIDIIFKLIVDSLYIQYLLWSGNEDDITVARTLPNPATAIPKGTYSVKNTIQKIGYLNLFNQVQKKRLSLNSCLYIRLKIYVNYFNKLITKDEYIKKYSIELIGLLPFILFVDDYGALHRSYIEKLIPILNNHFTVKFPSKIPLSIDDKIEMFNLFIKNANNRLMDHTFEFLNIILSHKQDIDYSKDILPILIYNYPTTKSFTEQQLMTIIRPYRTIFSMDIIDFDRLISIYREGKLSIINDGIFRAIMVYSLHYKFMKSRESFNTMISTLANASPEYRTTSLLCHLLETYCLSFLGTQEFKLLGLALVHSLFQRFPSNPKSFISDFSIILPRLLLILKNHTFIIESGAIVFKLFNYFIKMISLYHPNVKIKSTGVSTETVIQDNRFDLTSPIPETFFIALESFIPLLLSVSIDLLFRITSATTQQQQSLENEQIIHQIDALVNNINTLPPFRRNSELNEKVLKLTVSGYFDIGQIIKPHINTLGSESKSMIIKQIFKLFTNIFHFGSYGRYLLLDKMEIIFESFNNLMLNNYNYLLGKKFLHSIGSCGATYLRKLESL